MWRAFLLVLLLSIVNNTYAYDLAPYPNCDFMSQVTYGEQPVAGTVKLKYNGWKAVLVNEARRHYYNFWAESILLRSDGGLSSGYSQRMAELQFSKSEDDLLGRWWERRSWELSKTQVLTTWEIGNPADAIDLEVVKLTGDWRVQWREVEGKVSSWSWKIKPRNSFGSSGINNIGLLFNLGYKVRERRLVDVDIWAGWDKRRGMEAGIVVEIWRF